MAGIRVNIRAQVPQADLNRVEMQFNKVMNRMSGKEVAFNINGRSFTQPLGRITAQANEFTKSLEASNARVIAFGASVGIINAVSDAFKGLVAETVKFEKTLADINVILNGSNQGLQKFGDNLFKVAKNTAQSFNVVATAALEFSRQGLSMEETLKRTNDALILTRLTSLKAEEAVSGLTAAVNAFAETGLTTTNIIDKLAAVDVRFAVSSEDLIHALERTGAVAIDAGVELNDLIGLVTALQQTTARGGAVIGNGLKTIFTRIQRPESIRQIEELGVSVRNLTGAVLPADKILLNMAKSFDKMTQAQQSNVVQFSAGIFQANVFRAALRDLAKDSSLYEQASRVAGDAAGEAALKNEKLNKTLAALASQSSSAVRELAGVLGDLMVKPELGTFMEGFVSTVEGLKNALGGGEEEGSTFAKGFVRGIGNILTGPGLLAFGAVFVKMLMNVGKFASQSIKDVLGIVDKKEKVRQMEEAIVKVLSQNKSIQEGLNELEGDRVAQERFMLKIIEAQTNAMVKQKQIAGSLAGPLLKAGISTDLTVDSSDFVDLDKNAKIDSFGAKGVIPRSTVQREKQGAMQAGYQPGPVDAMEVKGMGRVVYNKAETIKKFPGMEQPAIMPPSSSRAGQTYKKSFHKQHGFDPYSELSAEKYAGFIPNYAKLGLKNNVTENQERMHLRGTPYQNLPDYVLKDIGGAANLAGANIKFKVKTSSFTGKIGEIGKYLNALGIDHVETTIPFDFVDVPVTSKGKMTKAAKAGLTTGTTKQRGNYAENQFLKSDAGKGYFSTAVDDQAVVDGISESGAPTEVKAASIDMQNILSKSIRRYSNQKFRETLMSVVNHHKDVTRSSLPNNLLEGFSTNGEIADALSGCIAKLEEDSIVKNLSTLARMGQYTIPGMSPEEVKSSIQKQSFRQELLSRGIGQSEKDLLMKYGMSSGFIPNFIKWSDRPGGGSKMPSPDNPGLYTKQEVDELKSMGYKRTDHHGWHFAKPVGLKHIPPTKLAPFGLAGPVSFDFLSRMIQHDREVLSIPNPEGDNADLDQLGQSIIPPNFQKNSAIIGYDSSVNRMQLIEGNHRVAALARLNKNRDKTMKFFTGMHAHVSGVKLKSPSEMDHSVGFVNQQIRPPAVPKDVLEAMKDPYRAPGQYVQGSWSPRDFGIPNFADFWDNPYFNEKAKVITDKETGTTLKYKNLTPGYADITHTQRGKSDKKGGAFRNFNKLVSEYDAIGSGMFVPQRAGIGPTPWARLVHMFPQMKNRIQKGLETMGDFRIDDTEMSFRSLVGLKKNYASLVRQMPDIETFVENFGNGPFFDDTVSIENTTTQKVKGKGDAAAGFKSKGLVPNFNVVTEAASAMFKASGLSQTYNRLMHEAANVVSATGVSDSVVLGSGKGPFQVGQFNIEQMDRRGPDGKKMSWKEYESAALAKTGHRDSRGVLKWSGSSAVDGFLPVTGDTQNDDELTVQVMEAKSASWKPTLVSDKFVRSVWENSANGSALWGGQDSPFNNKKPQKIKVEGTLVTPNKVTSALTGGLFNKGLIPNFYNLNRRNLSSGDKMSDRQKLVAMWQAKMNEKAPYAKKILNGTGARIELDPIISELNGHANDIWAELQKLRRGEDYKTTFPFKIPNFVDLEKVKQLAIRGVGGEKENAKRILNKRSIKSKNMFHDIIIDSFLDNPNQDYPPGTSIVDHLISLGYDENQIRSAAKNPQGYRRAAKGLIPNFENVHLKRGQTDPNAPLMEPSINPLLFEPILSANTPDDVYQKLLSFMQAHATGGFSGRSSVGTTGQLGKKLEDYITKSFLHSSGAFETWDEDSDPYSGKWINSEGLATDQVHSSGMMNIGSGAVSFTTRDAIADQFHKSKKDGGKAKGKIHEVTVPRKNIFGKKKLLRMLNMGARPPRYPMVDKLKGSIRDGSFSDYWKSKGGLFINIDGERNDRSLINLDKELNELRPELGKGEIRTNMFTRRMPTIAPHVDRESGQFYNEQEVTRIVNKGLVPNFAKLTSKQRSKLDKNREQQRNRVEGKKEFLSEGLTDYEKGLADSIFDYFLSNISGLSQGFRFDPSTLSLRATASDFTKIFRHTKSSKNQQILSDLAGGNSRLVNKILNNYMMHHTESMLLAKGQYQLDPDPLMQGAMFGGLVPSFSNPLMDAIKREKAAGVPGHRIKVEKSSQLRSPQNPAGLAVTNTRDEPGGVAQGIRRAKMMKIDPKKHGAAKGLVPNFSRKKSARDAKLKHRAEKSERISQMPQAQGDSIPAPAAPVDTSEHQDAHDKMAQSIISTGKEYLAGMDGIIQQLGDTQEDLDIKQKIDNFKKALDNAAKNFEQSGDASSVIHDTGLQAARKEVDMAVVGQAESSDPKRAKAGAEARTGMREMSKATAKAAAGLKELDKSQESNLQNLFFMQSAISMVNGQLQEFAETGGATTKALAAFGMGLSNTVASFIQAKELGGMLSQMAGNTDDKGRSDGTSFTFGNLFGEGRQERIGKTNTINERLADKRAARQPGFIGRQAMRGGGLGKTFQGISKFTSFLGTATKFGSRLIPLFGQLYTGFTAVNEIFKLFNDGEGILSLFESASDKAAKKLEKLGAISEAAAAALESVKNSAKIQDELTELQVKGSARTRSENERYLDLQIQSIDAKAKESEALAKLGDESVVGKRGLELYNQHMLKAGTTTAGTVKAIQELQIATKLLAVQQQQIVSFEKALGGADTDKEQEAVARRAGAGVAFSLEDMLTKLDSSGKVDTAATQANIDLFNNFSASANRDGSDINFKKFASKLQLNDGVNQDNISSLMQEFFQVIEDTDFDTEATENKQTEKFMKAIGDQLGRSGATSEGRQLFAENAEFKKILKRMIAAETKRLDLININVKHQASINSATRDILKAQQESVRAIGLVASSSFIHAEKIRKSAEIEEKAMVQSQAARGEFNKKLYGIMSKVLDAGNLGTGLDQEGGMTEEQLKESQREFNKRLQEAASLSASDINTSKAMEDINASLPQELQQTITEAQAEQARKILAGISVQVGNTGEGGSMQKALNNIGKVLADSEVDEFVKSTVMAMLKMRNIVQLELDHETAISDAVAALKQKNIEIQNSVSLEKKKAANDIRELEIKEKTVKGAVLLKNRIDQHGSVAKKIRESLMGEAANLQIVNDALRDQVEIELESKGLRAKILQGLEKQAREAASTSAQAMIGNTQKEIALGGAGGEDLADLQKKLKQQIMFKFGEELTAAEFAAKEVSFRKDLLNIQGLAARNAKAKSDTELINLQLATQEMAEKILYNNTSGNLVKTVKENLNQELLQLSDSRKTLQIKNKLLEVNNTRYMLALGQHDTEMEELRTSVQNTKDKLAIATLKGDIRKQAELQLEEELANSQKSGLIAAQNELILSGKSQLADQIKRANELQEMTNRVSEMRLAKDKAFVDQNTLEANARASNTTSKLSAFGEMRTAGTKASMTGNADDLLAAAQAQLAYNRALTGTTSALDQVNVELANIEVAASNLGSDLVSTAFATTKSELKSVFSEIAGGTKTIGEAFTDMGLNVASALADRLMDHNIDSIMKNLTFAFTGKKPENEADKMRNAIENGHLYGVDELRKQASDSSAELGNMLKNKMEEVKLDINVDIPDIKELESQLAGLPKNTANAFTEGSEAFSQKIKEAVGIEALDALIDGHSEAMKELAGSNSELAAALRNKKTEVDNENAAQKAAEQKAAQTKVTPATPIAPDKPEMRLDRAGLESQMTKTKEGIIANLSHQDVATDVALHGATRRFRNRDRVDPEKALRQAEIIKNYTDDRVFNEKRGELKLDKSGFGTPRLAMSKYAGRERGTDKFDKKTVTTDRVKFANQRSSSYDASAMLKNIQAQQDLQEKLNQYKSLEGQKSKEAAEALKALVEAAKKLGYTIDMIPVDKPKPITEYEGGKIQKYHEGGFVRGYKKGGEVPAILQEGEYVIPRKLAEGGRLKAGVTGFGQSAASTAGSYLANKWWGDDDKGDDNKPTFDTKRFNTLGLDSDVNMKANDSRLSARFRAENQATQDYGQYLLDMEDYKNQKINEKFQKRMGYLKAGLGVVVSSATDFAVQGLTLGAGAAIDGARNLGGSMGIGKAENVAAYKAAKADGLDVNYSQVAALNKKHRRAGTVPSYGEFTKISDKNISRKAANMEAANPLNWFKSNKKGNQDSDSTGFFARTFGTKEQRDAKKQAKLDDKQRKQGLVDHYTSGGFELSRISHDQLITDEVDSFIDNLYKKNAGGPIPAMLTKGEAVIPSAIASRIGYDNLNKMNTTGDFPIVDGKGGIDNVGPVGMNPGDFVIRKSSTDKLQRTNPNLMRFAAQNPDGFRRSAKGYYNGGIVDSELTYPSQSMGGGSYGTRQSPELSPQPETGGSGSTAGSSGGAVTNNINVNVTIDKSGGEASTESSDTQGEASSYNNEKQLSQKIKAAVLDVIRQEKRVGGELS